MSQQGRGDDEGEEAGLSDGEGHAGQVVAFL